MDAPTRLRHLAALACALVALGAALDAGWIHAKAGVAQHLLHASWRASARGTHAVKPWPWADTHPVARLRVPALGIDQIVLAGDSGRSLAFGPGWAEASARPGTHGTSVISGHRDTHFAFLQSVGPGTEVEIEGMQGSRRYRVVASRVVDVRRDAIALHANDALLLVTCYPFDAVRAGGPLRYVLELSPQAEAGAG